MGGSFTAVFKSVMTNNREQNMRNNMKFDYMTYKEIVEADRKETERMVENGELTEEDAWLRNAFREDEILDLFE